MSKQPTLETERLVLRPYTLDDAADVRRLAGDPVVADTALNIPHPYPEGAAEAWIGQHQGWFDAGEGVVYAVTLRATGELLGSVSMGINRKHNRAEMGYWIGKPYWNQGYATEAARALVGYGFQELGLNRIFAYHFSRNPASGRVMQKAGMAYEGRLRQHDKKEDGYEDLEAYGILREDLLPPGNG
jgi:RimJ/RimL family protein N-acetyltransferase